MATVIKTFWVAGQVPRYEDLPLQRACIEHIKKSLPRGAIIVQEGHENMFNDIYTIIYRVKAI